MKINTWQNCYDDGWQTDIVPEAFSHPAKFSRGLIHRIYKHAKEMGWVKSGDWVFDPFGGVALGALDAMSMGLNWIGVELESKFVDLATGFDCDGKVESHEELKHFEYVSGGWYIKLRLEAAYWGKSFKKMYGGWDEDEGFDSEQEAIDAKQKVFNQEGQDSDAYTVIYEEPEFERDEIVTIIDKPARCGNTKNHEFHHVFGNFELWQRPNLGIARIVQGDSRRLKDVIEQADIVISSPPYHDSEICSSKQSDKEQRKIDRKNKTWEGYGYTPGNLANLPEGKFEMVVSSPNFPTDQPCPSQTKAKKDYHAFTRGDGTKRDHEMRSPGNLANLPEGKFEMVVSSPPYADQPIQKNSGSIDRKKQYKTYRSQGGGASFEAFCKTQDLHSGDYGQSPGQLASMKEGSFDLCVSSPPYEASMTTQETKDYAGGTQVTRNYQRSYGKNKENLGNSSGGTFWSASREILQQCYELLKPGGHAIWVTKDYVKNKKRVPFSDRWLALCESVGFKLVCRHQAMLVKSRIGFLEEIKKERKSFFRRLAESKGSPRIDWEDILCFEKIGE